MKSIWRYLLFAILALPALVFAAHVPPNLEKATVCGARRLVTMNGVATTPFGASQNMEALRTLYGGHTDTRYRVSYAYAYNPTGWLIGDVRQAFAQIIAEYPGVTYEQWLVAVWTSIFPSSWSVALRATIAGRIGTMIGLQRPTGTVDADRDSMINDLRRFGAYNPPNDRLLFVGHSQGNILAVKIWDRITSAPLPAVSYLYLPAKPAYPAQAVGMLGVAVPVNWAMRNGDYVTSSRDGIVNSVKIISPVLPANINVYTPLDTTGHLFRETYLNQAFTSDINWRLDARFYWLRPAGPFPETPWGDIALGEWRDCGPGPALPTPCTISVGGVPRVYTTPMILYQQPGTGQMVVTPGSRSTLQSAILANAATCMNLWAQEHVNNTGRSSIPGCMSDYNGNGTWSILSHDEVEFSTFTPYPLPVEYHTARARGICRAG